jgi:ectoine hydroxylase-related dioxygenase (phytanoyl-CoA dioxygenase family)
MHALSHLQVLHFRRVGYLRVAAAASCERVDELRAVALALIAGREQPYLQAPDGAIERISSVWDRSEAIRKFFSSPPVLSPLQSLLGPNIVVIKNRHNHLTVNGPSTNDGRLHRDILQWSRSLVTAILYLEPSTSETGCTKIVPSSHFLPFVGIPNNGGTWMDEHEIFHDMLDQALDVPMNAGDMLLIDSVAFHAAGKNDSAKSRLSLAMGFHSVDELSSGPLPAHQALVSGTNLYRGNDRAKG